VTEQTPGADGTELSWSLGATAVYATLVKPLGSGPFPAVVMVAGSGPTDRDWNSPLLPGTNGSARLLANVLAKAGIASLRYDKRASGPHARENMPALIGRMSMQSHSEEVASAVQMLVARDDIRSEKIFALTNSEGALHALHYQLDAPVVRFAGLVLTAPPGRPVGDVARSQIAAQVAALPNSESILAVYDAAIAHFVAAEPVTPDPALPAAVQQLLRGLVTPANLPFARELWVTDAATLLAQIHVPVLVVIGKKDLQVDWQVDGELLRRAAAANADVTFSFPDNANHVLKYEPAARNDLVPGEVAAAYNGADARLDDDVQTRILDWLSAHS
jgi:pimeloyl-ACP methyl ester carboxylesterase